MAPKEQSDIFEQLESSRQVFNDVANGVSPQHHHLNPEPGRWSVLECVEHVAAVEDRWMYRLQSAVQIEPNIDRNKETELAKRAQDRSGRFDAPDFVRPNGRFSKLAEALEYFNAARARTIQFAQERSADLYSMGAQHPVFGSLNGYEALSIAVGHTLRHAAQIKEIQVALEKR